MILHYVQKSTIGLLAWIITLPPETINGKANSSFINQFPLIIWGIPMLMPPTCSITRSISILKITTSTWDKITMQRPGMSPDTITGDGSLTWDCGFIQKETEY